MANDVAAVVTLPELTNSLDDSLFDNTQVVIFTSYPRSDMGKGHFVGGCLSNAQDSTAIKFDGLLNTNLDKRHTTIDNDDLGTYMKFRPDKTFNESQYLIGGDLLFEFIKTYGENEYASFRPHVVLFFLNKIQQIFVNEGKPKYLFIEIGGTIDDYEVAPFVPPAITYAIKHWGAKVALLSELHYSDHHFKTKDLQRSIQACTEHSITPDYLLLRLPNDREVAEVSLDTIAETVSGRLSQTFSADQLFPIPSFNGDIVDGYKEVTKPFIERLSHE